MSSATVPSSSRSAATNNASTATAPASVTIRGLTSSEPSHAPLARQSRSSAMTASTSGAVGHGRVPRNPAKAPAPATSSTRDSAASRSRGRNRPDTRPDTSTSTPPSPKRTSGPRSLRACTPANASPKPGTIAWTATSTGRSSAWASRRSRSTASARSAAETSTITAPHSVRCGTSASFATRRGPRSAAADGSSCSPSTQ